MHHASLAEIEADVPEPGEDEHVTGLHAGALDAATRRPERIGAVRDVDPDPPIRPAHETGAVEAARRRLASPAVRDADRLEGDPRGALADAHVPRGVRIALCSVRSGGSAFGRGRVRRRSRPSPRGSAIATATSATRQTSLRRRRDIRREGTAVRARRERVAREPGLFVGAGW